MKYTTISLQDAIYQELKDRYNKSFINKNELARELDCSVSSINNHIVKGFGLPDYVKVGNAKNAPVLFPIASVASFFSNTVRVA